MTQTWWLSFVDPDRPEGEQFLGAVVVDVDEADVALAEPAATAIRASHGLPPLSEPRDQWMAAAIGKASRLHVNPGGEVASLRLDAIPGFATECPPYPRNQILSRAEIEKLDGTL